MNKKAIFLFLILFGLILIACENNAEIEIVDKFNCTPDISYLNDISPLLSQNCIPCHFDGTQLPDLSTYNSVNENTTLIKEVTQSRFMPLTGSLTQNEIDLIACWVDNGALNN